MKRVDMITALIPALGAGIPAPVFGADDAAAISEQEAYEIGLGKGKESNGCPRPPAANSA
jgi:hypothetical protein